MSQKIKLDEVEVTNYAGNSNKEKLKPVVKSKVTIKKPSIWSRTKGALTDSDSESVMSYILYDVAIPSIKTFITDAVSSGIQMLLWGGNNVPGNVNRYNGRSYTPYNSINNRSNIHIGGRPLNAQPNYARPRQKSMLDELIFESRTDAEMVLSDMSNHINQYGSISVLDLYDLIGKTTDHTANNFGWVHLEGVYIGPARGGGFLLTLPQPEML